MIDPRKALVVATTLAASACAYAHIGSGEVGVVRTPSGVQNKVYPTGDWPIGSADEATVYSVRSQERAERLDVLASDGLGITLDTSIRFHVIPGEVVALDQELGHDYYAVLLGPTLRSQARRVVGRFKPEEIYSSQRELIERQMREGIETAIKGRHIELEAVLVRNVVLPPQIQAAINDKLQKEQEALKMTFVLDKQKAENEQQIMQAKAEAERRSIDAQAQAEAQRIRAQGAAEADLISARAAADAKRLDAQATADYQKLVQQTLTPAILRLREIEASKAVAQSPNAKLVLMGGGGSGGGGGEKMLIDMRGADKTASVP
jgi:regulator of protease activity HflC (stomatin/prohibitin superfamily)